MTVLAGALELESKLRSVYERLKATPTPVPDGPSPRRTPRRRRRRIPIKGLDDKALREYYKNLRKQVTERARRLIEDAKKKVYALREAKAQANSAAIISWYVARYGMPAFDKVGFSGAQKAYIKYLDAQIVYWEGYAKMSVSQLATQLMGFYL